jgi:CBS domain-containing protein
MKVKELMSTKVLTVKPETPLVDAMSLFKENRIPGLPVMEDNKIAGMLSEEDVVEYMEVDFVGLVPVLPSPFDFIEAVLEMQVNVGDVREKFRRLKGSKVKDVMNEDFQSVSSDAHVSQAAQLMDKHDLEILPVVDGDKLVGVLTHSDLIRALI